MSEKKLVGAITHFFANINVGVIELEDTLRVGDRISIEGATTNIQQDVTSMQIDRKEVREAKKGESVGIKVRDRVRERDMVFRVKE